MLMIVVRICISNFQPQNPSKPIYEAIYAVIDDRTVKIFVSFLRQDSLMVTIEDEGFRFAQGSNDLSNLKKESPNLTYDNLAGSSPYQRV